MLHPLELVAASHRQEALAVQEALQVLPLEQEPERLAVVLQQALQARRFLRLYQLLLLQRMLLTRLLYQQRLLQLFQLRSFQLRLYQQRLLLLILQLLL